MEKSNFESRPVVLASASPRRRGFLHQLGYPFEVVTPATEEKARPGEDATAYVRRNAAEKAADVAGRVAPGTVVGEGAFFSGQPRSATVVATRDSQLWALKYARFQELSARQSAIALELAMACAAVVVRRLASTTLRVAVT